MLEASTHGYRLQRKGVDVSWDLRRFHKTNRGQLGMMSRRGSHQAELSSGVDVFGGGADAGGAKTSSFSRAAPSSSLCQRALALVALLIVQLSFAGYYVLTKWALAGGTNGLVFAFLRDAGGAAILMSAATVSNGRRVPLPKMEDGLLFVVMGLAGIYVSFKVLPRGRASSTVWCRACRRVRAQSGLG